MCIDLLEKIKCGPDEFIVVKIDRQTSPNQIIEIALALERFNLRGLIVGNKLEVDKMTRVELILFRNAANRALGE